MKAACQLKQPRDWFAARERFRWALGLLSDGAFKLFARICLHAERPRGERAFERAAVARSLGKGRSALGRHMAELSAKRVCEIESAQNQLRASRLRMLPALWPYQAAPLRPAAAGPAAPDGSCAAYVEPVRQRLVRSPACKHPLRLPTSGWRRHPIGDCPARPGAGLLAQVVRPDRPARRAADRQLALLRGPAGGGARRILPGSLLAAHRVQSRALRTALAHPAGHDAARPDCWVAGCRPRCPPVVEAGKIAAARSGGPLADPEGTPRRDEMTVPCHPLHKGSPLGGGPPYQAT